MKSPATIKTEALALIRQAGARGLHENELLEKIFPPPPFPAGQTPGADTPEIAAWRTARYDWTFRAYGGTHGAATPVPYRDSYASACSAATIELTKEKLIREHNNGYASYTFTPL